MNFFSKRSALAETLRDIQITAREQNKFTPDIAKLEMAEEHLFFIYNELQPGFPEFEKLEPHVQLHAFAYTDEKFVMQKCRLGFKTYPVIQRKDNYIATPPKRVKGRLMFVETEQIRNLDIRHENGVQFRRELIKIYLPFRKLIKLPSLQEGGVHTKAEYEAVFGTPHPSAHTEHARIVKAHCYVGIDDYFDPLIAPYDADSGNCWGNVRAYESRRSDIGPDYYYFTKRELFDASD